MKAEEVRQLGIELYVPVNDDARRTHTSTYGFAAKMVPEKAAGDGQWIRLSDLPAILQAHGIAERDKALLDLVDGWAEADGDKSKLCPPIRETVDAILRAHDAQEERKRIGVESGAALLQTRAEKAEGERDAIAEQREAWAEKFRQAETKFAQEATELEEAEERERVRAKHAEAFFKSEVEQLAISFERAANRRQEQGRKDNAAAWRAAASEVRNRFRRDDA